jgi:hypothetical protein
LSTIGKLSEKMILRRITPPKKNVTEFKSVWLPGGLYYDASIFKTGGLCQPKFEQ